MQKILILANAKSGTTILFEIIRKSLSGETVALFEPADCAPPEPAALGGKHVLAKVVFDNQLGLDHYGPAACSFYDKRIFIQRDPRDLLVSSFLYVTFHLAITSQFPKFARFVSALRAKEQTPRSVSFVDLLTLHETLSGDGLTPPPTIEHFLQVLRFAADVRRAYGGELFPMRYEDIVEGRFEALEEYLGIPLARVTNVDPQFQRVARTKGSGDWRNWFTPADVDVFRPLLREFMEELSYGDDWELPEQPRIAAENASGYLMRLAEDRGEFRTIDYAAATMPPELHLAAEGSSQHRDYLIPHVSPKQREAYPCRGAEIHDPHVEAPDGRPVNVLVSGERYVFTYEVQWQASCPGVTCWMAICGQTGDVILRGSTFFDYGDLPTVAAGSRFRVEFDFVCGWQSGMRFFNAGVTTSADGKTWSYAHRIVNGAVVFAGNARRFTPRIILEKGVALQLPPDGEIAESVFDPAWPLAPHRCRAA